MQMEQDLLQLCLGCYFLQSYWHSLQPSVREWIDPIQTEDLWISVLVIGEIRKGINLIQPRDPVSAFTLEQWLQESIENFNGQILPITLKIAEEWGRLNAIRSLPLADSLMAATANAHHLTLVTRNSSDFAATGLRVFNPFEA